MTKPTTLVFIQSLLEAETVRIERKTLDNVHHSLEIIADGETVFRIDSVKFSSLVDNGEEQ